MALRLVRVAEVVLELQDSYLFAATKDYESAIARASAFDKYARGFAADADDVCDAKVATSRAKGSNETPRIVADAHSFVTDISRRLLQTPPTKRRASAVMHTMETIGQARLSWHAATKVSEDHTESTKTVSAPPKDAAAAAEIAAVEAYVPQSTPIVRLERLAKFGFFAYPYAAGPIPESAAQEDRLRLAASMDINASCDGAQLTPLVSVWTAAGAAILSALTNNMFVASAITDVSVSVLVPAFTSQHSERRLCVYRLATSADDTSKTVCLTEVSTFSDAINVYTGSASALASAFKCEVVGGHGSCTDFEMNDNESLPPHVYIHYSDLQAVCTLVLSKNLRSMASALKLNMNTFVPRNAHKLDRIASKATCDVRHALMETLPKQTMPERIRAYVASYGVELLRTSSATPESPACPVVLPIAIRDKRAVDTNLDDFVEVVAIVDPWQRDSATDGTPNMNAVYSRVGPKQQYVAMRAADIVPETYMRSILELVVKYSGDCDGRVRVRDSDDAGKGAKRRHTRTRGRRVDQSSPKNAENESLVLLSWFAASASDHVADTHEHSDIESRVAAPYVIDMPDSLALALIGMSGTWSDDGFIALAMHPYQDAETLAPAQLDSRDDADVAVFTVAVTCADVRICVLSCVSAYYRHVDHLEQQRELLDAVSESMQMHSVGQRILPDVGSSCHAPYYHIAVPLQDDHRTTRGNLDVSSLEKLLPCSALSSSNNRLHLYVCDGSVQWGDMGGCLSCGSPLRALERSQDRCLEAVAYIQPFPDVNVLNNRVRTPCHIGTACFTSESTVRKYICGNATTEAVILVNALLDSNVSDANDTCYNHYMSRTFEYTDPCGDRCVIFDDHLACACSTDSEQSADLYSVPLEFWDVPCTSCSNVLQYDSLSTALSLADVLNLSHRTLVNMAYRASWVGPAHAHLANDSARISLAAVVGLCANLACWTLEHLHQHLNDTELGLDNVIDMLLNKWFAVNGISVVQLNQSPRHYVRLFSFFAAMIKHCMADNFSSGKDRRGAAHDSRTLALCTKAVMAIANAVASSSCAAHWKACVSSKQCIAMHLADCAIILVSQVVRAVSRSVLHRLENNTDARRVIDAGDRGTDEIPAYECTCAVKNSAEIDRFVNRLRSDIEAFAFTMYLNADKLAMSALHAAIIGSLHGPAPRSNIETVAMLFRCGYIYIQCLMRTGNSSALESTHVCSGCLLTHVVAEAHTTLEALTSLVALLSAAEVHERINLHNQTAVSQVVDADTSEDECTSEHENVEQVDSVMPESVGVGSLLELLALASRFVQCSESAITSISKQLGNPKHTCTSPALRANTA